MFRNIFAETKKSVDNFIFVYREEREVKNGKKGNVSIYSMVEAERINSNLLSIVPASLLLFLVEGFGMLWANTAGIKFDYRKGFLINFVVSTVFAVLFICIVDMRFDDSDFSPKNKKRIYRLYWVLFGAEAMALSIMEILDRGTVNNFLCCIFIYTIIPIISPTFKTIFLMLGFIFEASVMRGLQHSDNDLILLCFVAVLIGSATSFSVYYRYMNMKIMQKRLEHFANGDQLTALMNRRGFAERAPGIKKYCAKNNHKLLVLMADIDDFKKFNDTYGHIEGDVCLKNVATKIRENFSRPTDLCVRYGGEEFVVLSVVKNEERMLEHIKQMLKCVEEASRDDEKPITLSVGICITEKPGKADIHALIGKADGELYNAKTNGKNCLSYKGKIYRN